MHRVLRGLSVAVLVAGAVGLAGCQQGTDSAGSASGASAAVSASASASAGSRSPGPSARPSKTRAARPSRGSAQSGMPRATPTPPPAADKPPSSIRAQHKGVSVTKAVVSSDRRTLTLTYWQLSTSCGVQWRGHQTIVSGQLAVWMSQVNTTKPGQVSCAHITMCHANCNRTATLQLTSPLGHRAVYDAYSGKRLI